MAAVIRANASPAAGEAPNSQSKPAVSSGRKVLRRLSSFSVAPLSERHFFPQEGTLAEKVFLFFEDANGTSGGLAVAMIVMATIFVSSAAFCIETMPEYQDPNPLCGRCKANSTHPAAVDPVCGVTWGAGYSPSVPLATADCEPVKRGVFAKIEIVCIIIFTIDYLARMLTVACVRDAKKANVHAERNGAPVTGWRLATLDGLTKLGQPTPAKCAVCYAAPEVRSCTCAGRSTRASTRATAVVS